MCPGRSTPPLLQDLGLRSTTRGTRRGRAKPCVRWAGPSWVLLPVLRGRVRYWVLWVASPRCACSSPWQCLTRQRLHADVSTVVSGSIAHISYGLPRCARTWVKEFPSASRSYLTGLELCTFFLQVPRFPQSQVNPQRPFGNTFSPVKRLWDYAD